MQTSLFDYHLPEHLIARTPAERRDRSRLMVIDRASGKVTHTEFANLPDFLPQGARLFRNNATVLRARLRAQRPSGGQVECLLLRPAKAEDITFSATGEGAAKDVLSLVNGSYTANTTEPTTAQNSAQTANQPPAQTTDQPPVQTADHAPAKTAHPAPPETAHYTPAQISPWDFICLLKPGKRLRPGETFSLEGHFTATVLDKHPDGENRVRFTPLRGQKSVVEIATLAGDLPLPPYIEQARINDAKAQEGRKIATLDNHTGSNAMPSADNIPQGNAPAGHTLLKGTPHAAQPSAQSQARNEHQTVYAAPTRTDQSQADNERYQTVYADPTRTVAAAAPTAGLHFTPELLARLASQDIRAHDLTLHVGLDTFRPITVETIEDHQIHRELYEIPPATLDALEPLAERPRVAVGTTTLRSIEHYFRHRSDSHAQATSHRATDLADTNSSANEPIAASHPANTPDIISSTNSPWIAEADIFIYPPAQFAGVDALITNFHLPKSTLLCLVSAFLTPGSTDGIDWLKELYAEAISRNYRFFSYGDAMLIL